MLRKRWKTGAVFSALLIGFALGTVLPAGGIRAGSYPRHTVGLVAPLLGPLSRPLYSSKGVASSITEGSREKNPHLPFDFRLLELPRRRTAILVIDMINDIADRHGLFTGWHIWKQVDRRDLIRSINRLLTASRTAGVPIIFVGLNLGEKDVYAPHTSPLWKAAWDLHALEAGTWGVEFVDGLKPTSSDIVVVKHRISALDDTGLSQYLRAHGITTLILTGVTTNLAIEGTARQASDESYDVIVPEDGCASATQEMHAFSVHNILPLFARVVTIDDLISRLIAQSDTGRPHNAVKE
jgi:nicotinamidase-related amidase